MAIAFWILSGLAVFSAIMVITSERPIVSGLYLLLCFVSVAGLYVTLSAPFIAAMQLVVYSGAIIVLILFVIMLLNEHRETESRRSRIVTVLSVLASLTVGLLVYLSLTESRIVMSYTQLSPVGGMENNVEQIAELLFSRYFIPFELISLLLLAAIVSAVFLSKRKV